MTYYRRMWISGDTVNENTLEGVAIKLKSIRNEINSLEIGYERAQEALALIMEKQALASKAYKETKAKLVELAEELDDNCDGDCDCDCDEKE